MVALELDMFPSHNPGSNEHGQYRREGNANLPQVGADSSEQQPNQSLIGADWYDCALCTRMGGEYGIKCGFRCYLVQE